MHKIFKVVFHFCGFLEFDGVDGFKLDLNVPLRLSSIKGAVTTNTAVSAAASITTNTVIAEVTCCAHHAASDAVRNVNWSK
jgi:hypothetical protein